MAFRKVSASVEDEVAAIRAHFGERLDLPCLIVANGPSNVEARLTAEEIEGSVIFRANSFFLEDEPRYGVRVDGFFHSIDVKELRRSLDEVQKLGRYRIGAFFQPHIGSDSPERVSSPEAARMQPNFNHWSVLATDPTLALAMMARPLPTQGVQMLAFAAILGFRRLRVAGLDLFSGVARRYAWEVPEALKAGWKPEDEGPGYPTNHSLERDLFFLRAIRARYRFELTGITGMEALAPFLDRSEPRRAAPPPPAPAPARAFVTLADGRYAIGAMALARSLARVSEAPLVALHSDSETPARLAHLPNLTCRRVAPLENPNAIGQARFRAAYTKLRVFELTEFGRIVFLDADCVVLKPIDALFEGDGFLAAPDWGEALAPGFNSGVFAFTPSPALRDRVLAAAASMTSADGGDQGLLNAVLGGEVRLLPPEFNTLKRLPVHHPQLVNPAETKVLHFVGRKPWDPTNLEPDYAALEAVWAGFLEAEDWRIVHEMNRRMVAALLKRSGEGGGRTAAGGGLGRAALRRLGLAR